MLRKNSSQRFKDFVCRRHTPKVMTCAGLPEAIATAVGPLLAALLQVPVRSLPDCSQLAPEMLRSALAGTTVPLTIPSFGKAMMPLSVLTMAFTLPIAGTVASCQVSRESRTAHIKIPMFVPTKTVPPMSAQHDIE